MSTPKRYTITAALPYANGPKHIGHLAGAQLPADIYARYLRNKGEDVVYVCGSDEHGAAITIQAIKEQTTPRAIVDKYHALLKNCFATLGISFDVYHRTSEAIHHETAQAFFTTMYDKGLLQEDTTEQYYDPEAKVFLADRYIMGTCPRCGYENAYGDQCERCGSDLSPRELINPRSTISGQTPVLKATKHWSLPLNKYEDFLKEWLLEGHKEWKINVYGQCKSWIDGGLHPRAVTRDLDWGVKVPLKDAEGKVLYVWFDAPIGYISATKALFEEKKSGNYVYATPQKGVKSDSWEAYWQSPDTRLVHFLGKDNIVFHCIIFPVMLHAHGKFILPDNVPANEFLNLEGDKMSTSRKWSVEMHDYIEAFPGKEDVLRYVLTSIAPETKDSDFTWKDYQQRNNSELVAILGNFINRVMVLTHKFYEGKVPACAALTDADNQLIADYRQKLETLNDNIEHYKFRDAQFEMMNIARAGNKYLADNEPWKTIKTDAERTATVLNLSIQLAAHLAYVMEPFLPFTSAKLFEQLGLKRTMHADDFMVIQPGHVLNQPELLFNPIEDDIIEVQVQKLKTAADDKQRAETAKQAELPAVKSEITFDDFARMDIRIGTITHAEKVAKADKLLKLEIDLGFETRTVVSGIAEWYKPEDIIGKQVNILANLAPRKLKGIESKGMILMAKNADGSLSFVSPDPKADNGSTVA